MFHLRLKDKERRLLATVRCFLYFVCFQQYLIVVKILQIISSVITSNLICTSLMGLFIPNKRGALRIIHINRQ